MTSSPPKSALIVDDDDFSREIISETLAALGLQDIQMAENGRVALKALAAMAQVPDILICDVFMPDMDGIEFLGELGRQNYSGKFILVSGVDVEMLAIAREVAAAGKLQLLGSFIKPVSKATLAQALGLA